MKKLPCWLIGHRPKTVLLAAMVPPTYEEQCQNCHKKRLFEIRNDGRHNVVGWKVPTTA